MKLLALLPFLLVGCVPFDHSAAIDAEHGGRTDDLRLYKLEEINKELVRCMDLQLKAYEQVLVRLKCLENPEVHPIPRLKKNPEV